LPQASEARSRLILMPLGTPITALVSRAILRRKFVHGVVGCCRGCCCRFPGARRGCCLCWRCTVVSGTRANPEPGHTAGQDRPWHTHPLHPLRAKAHTPFRHGPVTLAVGAADEGVGLIVAGDAFGLRVEIKRKSAGAGRNRVTLCYSAKRRLLLCEAALRCKARVAAKHERVDHATRHSREVHRVPGSRLDRPRRRA